MNTFFRRLRNLTANLTAYIFGMTHDIDSRVCWKLQWVSYIVSKSHELWCSTNGLKLDRSFYPHTINSAFYIIARLRTRRSANRPQQNFAKR